MSDSDFNLVKRCLDGENEAFDSLVTLYQRSVYGFCYRMLGNADDAMDAAQASFIKAYYALDGFRSDGRFLSWLCGIANNTCIDMLRKRTKHRVDSLEDSLDEPCALSNADFCPEKAAMQGEVRSVVHSAVIALPEKQRASMIMFYFNGMSIKEISQMQERPENSIKSDLRIGRERLRRKLEGVVVDI